VSGDPYVWIAAMLTIGVFSFLVEDNPVFCAIEHLLVGLSTGYMFCVYWYRVFVPELVRPLWESGAGAEAHLWVVVAICVLWTCKYIERVKDLAKIALAFWLAVDLGLAIPTEMDAGVIAQVLGTIDVSFDGAIVNVVGEMVLLVGTVAALTYFVFSKPHRGVVGATAKLGTWVLMIGFGASFSYTILSRIYLLIGRVLFLLRDWLGVVG
jgi:hypothetical protein